MVTTAASPAAHPGLALNRRTRKKTSTANGTAISEMRNCPGRPTIWSISVGNSGVRMPDTRPPAATMSRLLRGVSAEVIAWVNAALLCDTAKVGFAVLAIGKDLFNILPTIEYPHDFGPISFNR